MALDSDSLVDRRRLKRQLGLWRTLAIVIAVALVAVAVGRFTGIRNQDHISRLVVENIIFDDLRRHEALKRVAADPDAKALIVRIDSPGGTVVGGEALYWSLRKIGETKPVVAVFEIHIEHTAVASMKPRTRRRPPVPPTRRIMPIARRLWAPLEAMAVERMKPPSSSRIRVWPYAPATCL